MIEWMKEYYEELMNGNQGNAHKIIQSNIPNKLYRYRNIKDYELESIRNNQLWVSRRSEKKAATLKYK